MQRSALLLFAIATTTACASQGTGSAASSATDVEAPKAVASVAPTDLARVRGSVEFQAVDNGVRVLADISGLTPNQKHGFHVHENGDCGDFGKAAGGHFDPDSNDHALPPTDARHAGDLGNLEADAMGNAKLDQVFSGISVNDEGDAVMGRAVIIHKKPDDGGGSSGHAGERIACGVINDAT